MIYLDDFEKSMFYDSLKKLSKWVPVGTGGYWEIRLWQEKNTEDYTDIVMREHNRLHGRNEDDN